MHTALEVARYVVARFQERGDLITNLKLQKLLYYVQGWHLGLEGERAFDGEFMAWVHGPVNYAVYQEFRALRWNPITQDVGEVKLDEGLAQHVDDVLDVYGGENAWMLERMTHAEAPWINARGDLPPDAECRNIIRDDDMRAFFAEQAANVQDQEDASA